MSITQNYVSNDGAEVIIGARAIARYIGICERTVSSWREKHALPVAQLPDGRIAISKSLLDQWFIERIGAFDAIQNRKGRPKLDKSNKQEVMTDTSKDGSQYKLGP